MRIIVGAVGRLKDSAERLLFERYWDRLRACGRSIGITDVRHVEIGEGRERNAPLRQASEAQRLLQACGDDPLVVALDERGKSMSTAAFAGLIRERRDDRCKTMAFLIGGPDGHGNAVIGEAQVKLSLSAMTLPHGIARVVLAEQLYRAATILSGHPYHRV